MNREEFEHKWSKITNTMKTVIYGEMGNCKDVDVISYKVYGNEILFYGYSLPIISIPLEKILSINGVVERFFVNGNYYYYNY